MNHRLFLKVLAGFWLAFIGINVTIWMMDILSQPVGMSRDMLIDKEISDFALSAAVAAARVGGESGLRAQLASWPLIQQQRLHIELEKDAQAEPLSIRAPVQGPDGIRYVIRYDLLNLPPPTIPNPFDIPMELLVAAMAAGLAFSAILAWNLTRPIHRIRMGFSRLAQGDFTVRLVPIMGRRRDEIADLAYDFDAMAARLQELVAARDRLLNDVSHEVRTPLARVQLAIALARQDPTRTEACFGQIDREVVHLNELVDELLTLAKLESGVAITDEYIDLAEVLQRVVEDAKFEATAAGVTVVADISAAGRDDVEWLVMGSGRMISRALENIVRNALRFSKRGQSVWVTLRVRADPDQRQLFIAVSDEGPGVPDDAIETLFEPFVQSRSGDGRGFGLGLAIAQRAIHAYGGTIAVSNRQPNGCVVTIALPVVFLHETARLSEVT